MNLRETKFALRQRAKQQRPYAKRTSNAWPIGYTFTYLNAAGVLLKVEF